MQPQLIEQLALEGASKPLPHPLARSGWRLLITLIAGIISVSYLGMREDLLSKIDEYVFVVEIVLMIALTVSAAIAASYLALPDCHQIPYIRFLPFIPGILFIGCFCNYFVNNDFMSMQESIQLSEFECIMRFIGTSLPPAILIFMSMRKDATTYGFWAAGLTGVSVVSFAYLQLRIVHDMDDPMGLLIWHVIPALTLMLLAAVLGRYLVGKIK